jgi:hypothetical protein
MNVEGLKEVHVLKAYRNTKLIRALHFKEIEEVEGPEHSYYYYYHY